MIVGAAGFDLTPGLEVQQFFDDSSRHRGRTREWSNAGERK
jgi:hypothetical protein